MRTLLRGTAAVAVIAIVLVGCEPLEEPPPPAPETPPQEEPDPEPPPGWSEYGSCEEAFQDPNVCGGCIVVDDDTAFAPNCVAETVLDNRCPYGFRVYDADAHDSSQHPLLDQVSDVGTLCATANYEVSLASLNRVSRMSHAMLNRNSEIANQMAPPVMYGGRVGGMIILLYAGEHWCDDGLPEVYAGRLRCDRPSFGGGGMFAMPIILCPENDLSICVHEIGHAVHKALWYLDGEEPIAERFAGLDIEDLWKIPEQMDGDTRYGEHRNPPVRLGYGSVSSSVSVLSVKLVVPARP